jgi:hypothetical protein
VASSPEHAYFMKPLVMALGEQLGTARGGDSDAT